MRWACVALFVIGYVLGSTPRADAGAIYKMHATNNLKDYQEIELTFEGTKVSGQARPLRGYPKPSPIEVTGANVADGVIELTFHLGKPERWRFRKTVDERDIIWTSVHDRKLAFWKPRRGELSEAYLTLNPTECGPLYRTLRFWPLAGASKEQLPPFLSGNPAIAELPAQVYDSAQEKYRRLPLGAALQELWPRSEEQESDGLNEQVRGIFDVPVGTEVTVAIALRQSGFLGADLELGGCGGSGPFSMFVYHRSFFFDGGTFLKDKFVASTEQGLKAFASRDKAGRAWDYTLSDQAVSDLRVSPFTSSYKAKVRMASEVSRQIPGWWDSFEVTFEPTDLTFVRRSEYSVLVTVDNVRSTSRSSGRAIRSKSSIDTLQATAEVSTALMFFLSRRVKDGWCYFGDNRVRPKKTRCDNPYRWSGPLYFE
jgi:hypothetical protein